jgi:hypothetical protein
LAAEGHHLSNEKATSRYYASIYLFVVGFYLLTASGRIGLSDGVAMLNVAESIINEGTLSSEPCDSTKVTTIEGGSVAPLCVPGVGGRYYSGYGLVPSLLAVPAILSGRLVSRSIHVNSALISKLSVSMLNVVVSPLVCVVLAMWILKLGYDRLTATIGACILAFASPFWSNSVKGFLSEPYFTLALLTAAYLLSNPRSRYACALSGLAFGAACGARLVGITLFPAFILALAAQNRMLRLPKAQLLRDVFNFSASVAVCMTFVAWSNYARFGSPLKTGYHLSYPSMAFMFSNPFFKGIFELLFDGQVGLLIFAPWVLLAVICFRPFALAHLPESVLCGTLFLVTLVFYAKSEAWHGGWVAGPRYLIPTLPFLIVMIAPYVRSLQHRVVPKTAFLSVLYPLVAISLVLGFLVQSVGAIFPTDRFYVLTEFYRNKPAKPWWSGSIPLASIDFLFHISGPQMITKAGASAVSDQVQVGREQEKAWAEIDSVGTGQEFLRLFPNSENFTAPNLLVFKMRLMGLPVLAGVGYLITVLVIGVAGFAGLRRYTPSH